MGISSQPSKNASRVLPNILDNDEEILQLVGGFGSRQLFGRWRSKNILQHHFVSCAEHDSNNSLGVIVHHWFVVWNILLFFHIYWE